MTISKHDPDWAASSSYDRGTCSVCERPNLRVLKDGTIGPHTTGKPATNWPYSSPRCTGWGQKPKETS
jgi:hypothetical protein